MTQPQPEALSVVIEREIAYPPEKIWRALTQSEMIAEWLMKNDFQPEVGRHFRLSGDWGGVDCEVLSVDPHNSLSYTWNHPNSDPAFDLRSVVTFTLTPTDNGTHLRIEQVGFGPEQKQAFHGARAGWTQHLANLEKAVVRAEG